MLSVLSLGWNLFVAVGERFCCCGGVFLMVFGVLFVFFCLFWYVWITWAPRGAKAPFPPLKKGQKTSPFWETFGSHVQRFRHHFFDFFLHGLRAAVFSIPVPFWLHFGSFFGAFLEYFSEDAKK
jgi:hypothetical protein